MNSQEADNSTSFYTTYSYEYDFVAGQTVPVAPTLSFPRRFISNVWTGLKTFVINTARVSWEFSTFTFTYVVFAQSRVAAFVYWLESIKDLLVKILMWRRGLLFRPTVHGGILALASVALVVGGLFHSSVVPKDFTRDLVLAAANTPETIVPEGRPRSEVIKYTVVKGQTLSHIASKFKVSVKSIKWANNLTSVDKIKPGDTLSIPPITGIVHNVKKSDTITSVAKKYEANAQAIADYPFNYIDDSLSLRVGQTLMVPGGIKPEPAPIYGPGSYPSKAPVIYVAGGSGLFGWPVRGSLNQTASWWHPAIDIGAPYGSPVVASAGGKVTEAGWSNNGYGNYVVINHNNGYSTTYAHMGSVSTSSKPGINEVSRGQQIGTLGCTGFCTGPHLHFVIYRNGSIINPLAVLP
jgi:murein DD-endopeptidase MepM/ murein hydrolase activator NlpD